MWVCQQKAKRCNDWKSWDGEDTSFHSPGCESLYARHECKFYTAANLSNELIEAQDNHKLVRLEKQIAKADLLIIDELSYLTFNRHQSELLFKVVADRAERRSVIVSTNLRFSEWTSMFENQTMVTALIDSLTFQSHVLNMNSDNPYRAEHAAVVSDDGKEADS